MLWLYVVKSINIMLYCSCMGQIVRNIQEAPFLHYVFDSKGGLGRSQRQKIPQDVLKNADPWSPIRESLSKMDPDGVILVQKLEPSGGCSSPTACCLAEAFQSANGDEEEDEEERVCPLCKLGEQKPMCGESLCKQEASIPMLATC